MRPCQGSARRVQVHVYYARRICATLLVLCYYSCTLLQPNTSPTYYIQYTVCRVTFGFAPIKNHVWFHAARRSDQGEPTPSAPTSWAGGRPPPAWPTLVGAHALGGGSSAGGVPASSQDEPKRHCFLRATSAPVAPCAAEAGDAPRPSSLALRSFPASSNALAAKCTASIRRALSPSSRLLSPT